MALLRTTEPEASHSCTKQDCLRPKVQNKSMGKGQRKRKRSRRRRMERERERGRQKQVVQATAKACHDLNFSLKPQYHRKLAHAHGPEAPSGRGRSFTESYSLDRSLTCNEGVGLGLASEEPTEAACAGTPGFSDALKSLTHQICVYIYIYI